MRKVENHCSRISLVVNAQRYFTKQRNWTTPEGVLHAEHVSLGGNILGNTQSVSILVTTLSAESKQEATWEGMSCFATWLESAFYRGGEGAAVGSLTASAQGSCSLTFEETGRETEGTPQSAGVLFSSL